MIADTVIHSTATRPKLKLKDVVKTLPQECFQKDPRKAWFSVCISVVAAGLGYLSIAYAPWFLLPLAWILTGTALTGWFVIAHDCGHRSFAKRRWVNDWVGHLMLLPLLYPFHSWRLLHDIHHRHTNKLDIDNAWHPWTVQMYQQSGPLMQKIYQALRGGFWWLASVAHWATLHFNPAEVAERDQKKMKFSIAVVLGFASMAFPTIILTLGWWGLVKFWLMPWLVYHFWMSTFTLVHHTLPDIQFYPVETWDEVTSQLEGTVHCDYPKWVEWLCHDINVHVPHHLSVAIPSYNLRMAHASLREQWGHRLIERSFSWNLIREIIDQCHLYHPDQAYIAFADLEG